MQYDVAQQATFQDNVGSLSCVGAIDQGFPDGQVRTAVVAPEQTVVYEEHVGLPYIPGYLSFREGPAAVEALRRLEHGVDCLIVDGSGRLHPRQAGLATHLGVVFDVPTIGVAESLLCGDLDIEGSMCEGERREITAGGIDGVDGLVGYAYQSKQYRPGSEQSINPLFVSPGHSVSAETAVDLVASHVSDRKLPEPLVEADELASSATG